MPTAERSSSFLNPKEKCLATRAQRTLSTAPQAGHQISSTYSIKRVRHKKSFGDVTEAVGTLRRGVFAEESRQAPSSQLHNLIQKIQRSLSTGNPFFHEFFDMVFDD